MSIKRKVVSRAGSLAAAVAVALGALVPAIVPMVSAAAQVQTRSIEMSDSTPGQTGVSYKVTFTPATTGAQSLIIDFCSNSSIIGGACTAPTGFNANTSIGLTVGTNTTGWVVDTSTALDSASTVTVNKGTGAALGTTASDFTLTGITNSTTLGSFWARIYTYTDATYGSSGTQYTTPQALGTYSDYGGFAMSTVELINITATVMETLTFCTSKAAPAATCTGTTTPNLILGHGTPQVLDSTVNDVDTAYFQISTNALTGAIIRMKSHNTCINGGLSRDGGATCPIPGIGALAGFTPATAQFGMNVQAVAGGTGSVLADADYDGTTTTNYGMGNTTIGGTNDPSSTYGADIATTNSTAAANVNSLLTFSAQAAVTTPAGVYSVNESLIATGTF